MNGFNGFIGAIATIILRNITPQYTAIILVHPTWGRGEGGGVDWQWPLILLLFSFP